MEGFRSQNGWTWLKKNLIALLKSIHECSMPLKKPNKSLQPTAQSAARYARSTLGGG
jgi:hypothetical protein